MTETHLLPVMCPLIEMSVAWGWSPRLPISVKW